MCVTNEKKNKGWPSQSKQEIKDQPSAPEVSKDSNMAAGLSGGEAIALAIFNCILSFAGTVTNLTVILAYLTCASERGPTDLLLVSLSGSDFLLCSVYQPVFIHDLLAAGRVPRLLRSFIGYGLMTASLNGLFAVTVDRFVAVYFPYKYPLLLSTTNAKRFIYCGWLVALVTAVLVVLPSAAITQSVCHVYVSLLMLIEPVMYGFIWYEARKQEKLIHEMQKAPEPIPPAEETNSKPTLAWATPQSQAPDPPHPSQPQDPHPPLPFHPSQLQDLHPPHPQAPHPPRPPRVVCALASPVPGMRLRCPTVRFPVHPEPDSPRQMDERGAIQGGASDAGGPTAPALSPPTQSGAKLRFSRSTKLVGLVLVTNWSSWLLFVLFPVLWPPGEVVRGITWAIAAASVNSCANPLLYCWMSSKFRRLVRKALARLWAGITTYIQ